MWERRKINEDDFTGVEQELLRLRLYRSASGNPVSIRYIGRWERLTRGGRETIMGEVGRVGELHGMMFSSVPVSFTMNTYLFPAKKHKKIVRICVKQGGK